MRTNAEAQFWRQIQDVDTAEQPDDFFYRVDSLMGVRTIRRDTLLRPRRWDTGDRHPHVELLAADERRAPHQAIYRLSHRMLRCPSAPVPITWPAEPS